MIMGRKLPFETQLDIETKDRQENYVPNFSQVFLGWFLKKIRFRHLDWPCVDMGVYPVAEILWQSAVQFDR